MERLVVVYDLGGGTLDVAVLRLERSSKTFLVMGTAGDPHLGQGVTGHTGSTRTTVFRLWANSHHPRWQAALTTSVSCPLTANV